jgi:hypothetical protein
LTLGPCDSTGPLGDDQAGLGELLPLENRIRVVRDLLLSWWPPRLANSGLFAQRALTVLADPELADYFNQRDYRVQAALLACPYGTSLQPLASFLTVTDLHLPDHPWPALEMVEVLQRAARWDDAAEVARHPLVAGARSGHREQGQEQA